MQLQFTFVNEHGQSYTWRPECKDSEKVLQEAKRFKAKLDAVQVGMLEDHETPWSCKGDPKIFQKRQRVQQKRDRKPKAHSTAKKRASKKNWLVTPREFETVKHETLVKRLKRFYADGGDRNVFLSYIRLMKLIYRADFLTVDRMIDARDFYHEVKEIYTTIEKWTPQMMAALSDFRFMFDREEWARLDHRKQSQNREKKKAAKNLDLATDETETEPLESLEQVAEKKKEPDNEKKNFPKALRKKMKNFQNKGGKKKKRGFWI